MNYACPVKFFEKDSVAHFTGPTNLILQWKSRLKKSKNMIEEKYSLFLLGMNKEKYYISFMQWSV